MFSIVIPLYNKRDFILQTVESVFAQSVTDFELIVIDDGSTDDSALLLEAIDDPRLRLIRQENAGKGAARSRGMKESRRTWIAFIDADDLWFPDHLAELAAMAALHPEAGLLTTNYSEGADPAAATPGGRSNIRPISYFREAARNIGVVWSSATALRRDVAWRVGDFGAWRTGEDLEYWARVAMAAPVIKSDRVTAYYLRNDKSEMAQVHREETLAPSRRSLFEAWPSVGYLESVKPNVDSRLRSKIERYQRSAGYLTILSRVHGRDLEGARQIARELPGLHVDRAALASLLLRLPAPVLNLALATRKRFRERRA